MELKHYLKSYNPKNTWRMGARGRSGNGGRQQKTTELWNATWPEVPPTHSNPYSQPCMRKTFSASFVPPPAENHTSYFFLSNVSQLLFVSVSVYWGKISCLSLPFFLSFAHFICHFIYSIFPVSLVCPFIVWLLSQYTCANSFAFSWTRCLFHVKIILD